MSRPCAYCKEIGHHIRDCRELAEKNRRQAMKKNAPPRLEHKQAQTRPNLIKINKSIFANLYSSSDDELEEGEIIKNKRQEDEWSRSGINSVNIQIPVYTSDSSKDSSNDDDKEDHPKYIYEPSAAWIKYKGWSWVDIEYDSE